MLFKKKVMGLVTFSIGFGMLLAVIFGPVWTAVIAVILVIIGAWNLFFC